MQHTFLLKEGHWKAEGVHYGPAGDAKPAKGYTTVIHERDVWKLEGELKMGSIRAWRLSA